MQDRTNNLSSDLSISVPSNRKNCFVCSKIVYLHQPLLYCQKCNHVFHGKCLKLTNEKTFVLQQLRWICVKCSCINFPVFKDYCCNSCSKVIHIYNEKFVQCKQCFKILHSNNKCRISKLCKNCLPIKIDLVLSCKEKIVAESSVATDFYNGLPIFNPFNCETINFDILPDADSLSDNLQNCSTPGGDFVSISKAGSSQLCSSGKSL